MSSIATRRCCLLVLTIGGGVFLGSLVALGDLRSLCGRVGYYSSLKSWCRHQSLVFRSLQSQLAAFKEFA
jgi:hypothetical protein